MCIRDRPSSTPCRLYPAGTRWRTRGRSPRATWIRRRARPSTPSACASREGPSPHVSSCGRAAAAW
eukprot:5773894-Alexandrium_andersonii.AAC.1